MEAHKKKYHLFSRYPGDASYSKNLIGSKAAFFACASVTTSPVPCGDISNQLWLFPVRINFIGLKPIVRAEA
jgi:hypothetical protein